MIGQVPFHAVRREEELVALGSREEENQLESRHVNWSKRSENLHRPTEEVPDERIELKIGRALPAPGRPPRGRLRACVPTIVDSREEERREGVQESIRRHSGNADSASENREPIRLSIAR